MKKSDFYFNQKIEYIKKRENISRRIRKEVDDYMENRSDATFIGRFLKAVVFTYYMSMLAFPYFLLALFSSLGIENGAIHNILHIAGPLGIVLIIINSMDTRDLFHRSFNRNNFWANLPVFTFSYFFLGINEYKKIALHEVIWKIDEYFSLGRKMTKKLEKENKKEFDAIDEKIKELDEKIEQYQELEAFGLEN